MQSTTKCQTNQMKSKKSLVLFGSDSNESIEVLRMALPPDYRFNAVHTAKKALKIIRNKPYPDIILLDTGMQGMNSFEICRQLKENELSKDIPVIFIAEKGHIDEETKAFEVGAVDFISKPINPTISKARIKIHLKLKQQRDFLVTLAEIDGLTGISNRRRFDEVLSKDFKNALREQKPIALLMIDIDDFKQFNDHYGHQAGDEALKQVVRTINKTLNRPMDHVARYGGEEFVCLLPGTDLEGMKLIAESILEAVRALQTPHNFSRATNILTHILGGASIIPEHGHDPKIIVEIADKMLYKAKESGRNCFVYR